MPRQRSPQRLAGLVEAAVAAFVEHGYGRTQVEDIADRLGVAKGTVYGYVTSKEALFALALAYGDGNGPLPDLAQLPVEARALPQPADVVQSRLASELEGLVLLQAAASPGPDAPAELEQIVADLLPRLQRHRVAIKLADRCATEFPELAAVWFEGGRWGQVEVLAGYLEHQADAGRLQLPGDSGVLARSVIELCALWAVHLHWDPAPRPVDDAVVLATVPAMIRRLVAADAATERKEEDHD